LLDRAGLVDGAPRRPLQAAGAALVLGSVLIIVLSDRR
jgi:hypothetical protein